MTSPFRIDLGGRGFAGAVHVSEAGELGAALGALGLHPPRPTVVVVGGAAGLREARMEGLRPLFADAIVPVIEGCGGIGVDGGTRFGVMRLFGEARAGREAIFPLVGVVAAGPVQLPARQPSAHAAAVLEPHHTHFVVVPGDRWGAEAPWLARTATALAAGAPSVTVLINGGRIAYTDVAQSVQANRPVVTVSGSGGTADAFAGVLAGDKGDETAAPLVESGLIHAVPMDEPAVLAEFLGATLRQSGAE